ncbi:hypothetical protein CJP74_01110 [Psittacicella melopsittaci]|uniref:Ion-translocating oxidoreductase complex subunit C n=1 Tax=Psittacicella melopsittaci TaxID=2028576 RepID=A0A3A1Y915_9GAMM|nr:4Fe-4S dicluster domain-containing protein [Psittacicella melopsittaci]RIY33710.1 hypothetical protein CJP74_01110 [Psittacicella melopsittaci]
MVFNSLKAVFSQTAKILTKRDIALKLHKRLGKDKLYHFHGGLHLDLGKHLTRSAPVYQIADLNYYLINMIQHKGPKPISLVHEGDQVEAGQLLTSNYIPGELPIHSPVKGKILTITEFLQASELSKTCKTIVVENAEQTPVSLTQETNFNEGTPIGPAFYQPLNYLEAPRIELLWRVKNAGIAGLGGGVFPSARKINNRHFKTLLINAAECEPYITCDDVLMQNYASQLVEAISCMQHLLQTEKVVIAIEDDKPVAIQRLQEQIKREQEKYLTLLSQVNFPTDKLALACQEEIPAELKEKYSSATLQAAAKLYALNSIKIRVIPTRYPSGNQRTTIEVLTGLRLTKKQNLTSLGAICFNIGTVYSMYRAIAYGEVLTQRLVTITGTGIKKPGNYWIPFGATPALILDLLGANPDFTNKVIMGGPMMGFALDDLNAPINKATNCLIFVGKGDIEADQKLFAPGEEQACIRCTACQDVCPMLLQPQQMHWFEKDKDDAKLIKANLSSCIECGLCDYVCPSNIPLVSYFQSGKYRIWNERKKVQTAEESKARFEVKSLREQIAKAERDAKRAADKQRNLERAQQMRQKAIAESGVDPIEAAKARLKARGVVTGQDTQVTAGANAPDNSAIMEQRRLRRLQRQQEQAAAQNEGASKPALDKSAVLAAVAAAKARQAQAQGQQSTPATGDNSAPMTAVQKAVAAAKARQAQAQQEAQGENSAPMTAVQKAVAAAKARQAQAQQEAQAQGENSAPMTAVQKAVAAAKARQAQAQQEAQAQGENSAPMTAVQKAVAAAKARQAQAKAEAESKAPEQAETAPVAEAKMTAVQKAVALAKARQAQAKAEAENQAPEQAETAPKAEAKMTAVQKAVALAKARQAQAKAESENKAPEQAETAPVAEAKMTAVQKAVAAAKARQAQAKAEAENQAPEQAETAPEAEAKMTAVQKAVALAKARQAQAKAQAESKATEKAETAPEADAKMTAVQKAVALAKARQAQAKAQAENQAPEQAETAPEAEAKMTAVQKAVALAKARQAQAKAQAENQAPEQAETAPEADAKMTAVQKAVALAKARQAQAKAQAENQAPEQAPQVAEQAEVAPEADAKMTAVQRAVALAKARQAQAKTEAENQAPEQAPQITEQEAVTPEADDKMTAVQRAVALAKARQAQRLAQENTSNSTLGDSNEKYQ